MKEKINQTAGRLKQTVRGGRCWYCHTTASFFMSAPAYAAGVQDSQIVKGTEKLVGDVTTPGWIGSGAGCGRSAYHLFLHPARHG